MGCDSSARFAPTRFYFIYRIIGDQTSRLLKKVQYPAAVFDHVSSCGIMFHHHSEDHVPDWMRVESALEAVAKDTPRRARSADDLSRPRKKEETVRSEVNVR